MSQIVINRFPDKRVGFEPFFFFKKKKTFTGNPSVGHVLLLFDEFSMDGTCCAPPQAWWKPFFDPLRWSTVQMLFRLDPTGRKDRIPEVWIFVFFSWAKFSEMIFICSSGRVAHKSSRRLPNRRADHALWTFPECYASWDLLRSQEELEQCRFLGHTLCPKWMRQRFFRNAAPMVMLENFGLDEIYFIFTKRKHWI